MFVLRFLGFATFVYRLYFAFLCGFRFWVFFRKFGSLIEF